LAVSPLLTSAMIEALSRYADLRPRWRAVYTGLLKMSQTRGGLMRYQPDHLIDLFVRAMEDELAVRHQLAPAGDEHVHLEDTLQFVLTRYWVLGTHDALRIAARSPEKFIRTCSQYTSGSGSSGCRSPNSKSPETTP
jgi:hypothetical protein